MTLTIATYKAQIQAIKNQYPELALILFAEEGGSKFDEFNLQADTFAQCAGIQGQLFDLYQQTITGIANSVVPTTDPWVQNAVLKFQYSATNPQYVQMVGLIPGYPTIDDALRIISRCSAVTQGNGVVNIKVATGTTPRPLTADQLTALKSYLENVLGAGVRTHVSNAAADQLYLNASIFFDGQFVSSIQADVQTAINNYLATIPFNGIVVKSNIELAIKSVRGVNDVVINSMAGRADGSTFTGVDSGRKWPTVAGYIIGETTTGKTFADSITYTAE
jgi:hypothetical protein